MAGSQNGKDYDGEFVTRRELNERMEGVAPTEELRLTNSQVQHIAVQMAERGQDYGKRFDKLEAELEVLASAAQKAEVAAARVAERVVALSKTFGFWAKVGAAIFTGATLALITTLLKLRG